MTIKRAVAAAALATISLSLTACGSHEPDDYDAYAACENWVGEQLRAPSTADFSGHNDSQIVETANGYDIKGYVDAQNGFGAQIRTDWSCSVALVGDNWELLDLNVS
jgi:hypothetical protein